MECITKELKDADREEVMALYEWLKEKQLTAGRALRLLNITEQVIYSSRQAAADKIML